MIKELRLCAFFLSLLPACTAPIGIHQAGLNNPTDAVFICVKDGKTLKPDDCTLSGGEIFAFIINEKPGELAVLNLTRKKYTDTDKFIPGYTRLAMGEIPSDIISLSDGAIVVVANRGSRDFAVVDPVSLDVKRFQAGFAPAKMASVRDADGKESLIVTSPEQGSIYVIAADDLKDFSGEPPMREIKTEGSPLFIASHIKEGAIDLYIGNESHRFLTVVSGFGGSKEEVLYYSIFPECLDDIDNDNDLLLDRDDPDCTSPFDDSEEKGVADRCLVGIDNDKDGFTDAEDGQCPFDEYNITSVCSDEIDNDGDGFTDYGEDRGCFNKFSGTETEIPRSPTGPLAVSPHGRYVYIANRAVSSITIFDTATMKRIDVNDMDNLELGGQNPLLKKLGVTDIEVPTPPSGIVFIEKEGEQTAFVSTDSGYIYVVEVLREGKYLHRLESVSDDLKSSATKPVLKVNNEVVDLSISMRPEYPSFGQPFVYPLGDGTERYSYYGIVFHGNPRLELSEVWNVVYEGVISGASGETGFVLDAGGVFTDPFRNFCLKGVVPGDHLIIKFSTPINCVGFKGSEFEFRISALAGNNLTLEPLLPGDPLPDPFCFKGALKYEIRAADSWVVTGSRSGFLHSNYTENKGDGSASECKENQSEKELGFTGRAFTSKFKEGTSITTCPPLAGSAEVEWKPFMNNAFTFEIYPPCSFDENFKPYPVKEIRDTSLIFTSSSGFVPFSIRIAGSLSSILVNEYNSLIYAIDSTSNNIAVIHPDSRRIIAYYY